MSAQIIELKIPIEDLIITLGRTTEQLKKSKFAEISRCEVQAINGPRLSAKEALREVGMQLLTTARAIEIYEESEQLKKGSLCRE